jgi:hypothetical protein
MQPVRFDRIIASLCICGKPKKAYCYECFAAYCSVECKLSDRDHACNDKSIPRNHFIANLITEFEHKSIIPHYNQGIVIVNCINDIPKFKWVSRKAFTPELVSQEILNRVEFVIKKSIPGYNIAYLLIGNNVTVTGSLIVNSPENGTPIFLPGCNIFTTCHTCKIDKDIMFKCSACKSVAYCSVACQRSDYPQHKKKCVSNSSFELSTIIAASMSRIMITEDKVISLGYGKHCIILTYTEGKDEDEDKGKGNDAMMLPPIPLSLTDMKNNVPLAQSLKNISPDFFDETLSDVEKTQLHENILCIFIYNGVSSALIPYSTIDYETDILFEMDNTANINHSNHSDHSDNTDEKKFIQEVISFKIGSS